MFNERAVVGKYLWGWIPAAPLVEPSSVYAFRDAMQTGSTVVNFDNVPEFHSL